MVSNPAFLTEGTAVADFLAPDRVVLGSDDRVAVAIVASLYLELRLPLAITDLHAADRIEYASNAFLETHLSFVHPIPPPSGHRALA